MKIRLHLFFGLVVAPICGTEALAQTPGLNAAPSPFVRSEPGQLPGAPLPGPGRIGFVDVDRVAALSGEGKAAAARLEDLRSRKAAEVAARSKQVEAAQAKLSQGESVLNEVARARLQREFQRAQVNFQRFTEDAQAEVRDLQQEVLQTFNARLFPVIAQVAKEKNLWAVFSRDGALWHDPTLDLSDEVAKRLDGAATPGR